MSHGQQSLRIVTSLRNEFGTARVVLRCSTHSKGGTNKHTTLTVDILGNATPGKTSNIAHDLRGHTTLEVQGAIPLSSDVWTWV